MDAEGSPFPYQGPLEPGLVAGRDHLVTELTERLTERRLTAVTGPRRYGKTSLLKRVSADLAAIGPDTVWIDFYELNSMADLAAAFDRGLAQVSGTTRTVLDAVADSQSIKLGAVSVDLARGRRHRPEPVLALRSLLQVLVLTAQSHPLIVVFDEFSGIANVAGAAGVLRTELQHHYSDLGIVFAGSQPAIMHTLFGDQSEAFFAQADLIEIGPLTDRAAADIVNSGFERTGRRAGFAANQIVTFTEGHPQRLMQLADAVWRSTPEGTIADETDWAVALSGVRAMVDNNTERLYELIPAGQQKTLRVVASGGSVYGAAAEALNLAHSTAQAAVDALTGTGYLVRRDDRLEVVDPLFADWIRRRFPL